MPIATLNPRGWISPQHVLQVAASTARVRPGDILEVIVDCSSFGMNPHRWDDKSLNRFNLIDKGSERGQVNF